MTPFTKDFFMNTRSNRFRFCAGMLLLVLAMAHAGWRQTSGPGDISAADAVQLIVPALAM
jgi:hypothetical protein